MKTRIFYFFVFLFFTLATSCEKSDIGVNNDFDMREDSFLEGELIHVGNRLFNFVLDDFDEFRCFVYKEIEKQFDGDYNVLINIIDEKFIKKKKHNECILEGEFGRYFDDRDIFPQIYIPFFEELKMKGKLGKKNPVLVYYVDENDNGLYPGYVVDENGKQNKLDFLISEKYAENNEVWVFSINERVDGNGKVVYNNEEDNLVEFFWGNDIVDNFIKSTSVGRKSDCISLNPPTGVKVLPKNPYSLYISWGEVPGAKYYKIFRDVNFSGNFVYVKTISNGSSWANTGLTGGSYYMYQVQSFKDETCYSTRTNAVGAYASWRQFNKRDKIYKIFISKGCWNWCCSWPEGKIELYYRLIKYRKDENEVEYPKGHLPKTKKKHQKGKWHTYNKDLFIWELKNMLIIT